MANKVPTSAPLGRPVALSSFEAIEQFLGVLVNALFSLLTTYGVRLNGSLPADGTEAMIAPLPLMSYVKTALPAAIIPGQIIYVSNDTSGAVLAFSDGTNWRRVTDRNIIS